MQPDIIAVVATVIKFLMDAIKAAFPGLQGRYTQLVVLILSAVAGLWLVGTKDPVSLLSFIGAVGMAAVGVDQILKRAPGDVKA